MNTRNNRFDILIEKQEVKPQRHAKEVPAKKILPTNSNVFKKDNAIVSLPVQDVSVNETNFPELCDRKEVSVQKAISYTKLFKEEEEKKKTEEKESDQVYMDGWLFLKRGMKIQKVANMQPSIKNVEKDKEKEKEQVVSFKEVFDSIVETHRRRTNEFIELNDYDTWYKMYQFPDRNLFEDDEENTEEYEEYDSDLSSESEY